MRAKLLARVILLLVVFVLMGLVVAFARQLGLSEIAVVLTLMGIVLMIECVRYVVRQAVRSFRD